MPEPNCSGVNINVSQTVEYTKWAHGSNEKISNSLAEWRMEWRPFVLDPGGIAEISRGLSEVSTDTKRHPRIRFPMSYDPGRVAETPSMSFNVVCDPRRGRIVMAHGTGGVAPHDCLSAIMLSSTPG